MADENGIVVKPAIVKQDGNTTEIEIHIEKPAEPEREQTEAAEAAQDKPRKSLTEVLYLPQNKRAEICRRCEGRCRAETRVRFRRLLGNEQRRAVQPVLQHGGQQRATDLHC